MSVSGYDGICPFCRKWFMQCQCGTGDNKLLWSIDDCGNKWFPFEIARHWSIGVPVVVRITARETGLFNYSVCSRWQSPGVNPFGDTAMFLMLDRMPQ